MEKKNKILILGAYGQSNIGDEMMLQAIVSYLKSKGFDNIVTNSSNPVETSKIFGVRSFYTSIKKDLFRFLYNLFTADVIIYGGGSLLVELRMNQMMRARTPLYRTFLINLFSRLTGKKAVFCGIGVEEVSSDFSSLLIKWIVKLSTFCYVRDSLSYEILKNYHCDMRKVGVSGELALVLKPNYRQNNLKRGKIKRICVFPAYRIIGFDNYYEKYIETLSQYKDYYNKLGIGVEFYPMQTYRDDINNDTVVIKDITGGELSPRMFADRTYKSFLKYLSKFDLVLSSRYHGIVSAIILNIPAISITEYKKNIGFLSDMGLSELSLKSSISVSQLRDITSLIDENYSEYIELIDHNKKLLKREVDNMLGEIIVNYL